MRVGLIHAMTASIEPIETAYRRIAPTVNLIHFMDTGLLSLLQQEKKLTPTIMKRFSKLTDLAAESDIDCIQLTCSAFNDLTNILQPFYEVKLFRSDEAMLNRALSFKRIGLISTVDETPPVLQRYIKSKNPTIEVTVSVNTEALQFLQTDQTRHDEMIREMVLEQEPSVDVIVLSQYSMAHVAKQFNNFSIPILAGPEESVKHCVEYLTTKNVDRS